MGKKIILTGATGMVGEGVLLECLEHPEIEQVLVVSRRSNNRQHPKLKECIVRDFFELDKVQEQLRGYDACFYCAGVSSVGMKEAAYTYITYDTVIHFAKTVLALNPEMIFCHISGGHTDSSEQGRAMWARVKGKAENALIKMPFRQVYNFRPGFMKPTKGQKNVKSLFRVITGLYPVLRLVFPNNVSTMKQVGLAMINSVLKGYPKQILEIKDINELAGNVHSTSHAVPG